MTFLKFRPRRFTSSSRSRTSSHLTARARSTRFLLQLSRAFVAHVSGLTALEPERRCEHLVTAARLYVEAAAISEARQVELEDVCNELRRVDANEGQKCAEQLRSLKRKVERSFRK